MKVIINNLYNHFELNLNKIYLLIKKAIMGIGDWGLGIGDWGLGIGPNPQSPNPQSPIPIIIAFLINKYILFKFSSK